MLAIQSQSSLQCSVLVLNKHYMPLRIIGARRALALLWGQQAEVVSCEEGRYTNYDFHSWRDMSQLRKAFAPDEDDWVSTVNFYIAVPRIVRLLFYDRLPRTGVKFNRRNIYARDENKCQYCGKRFPTNELSLDHIIPKSIGGGTTWKNIVCACTGCNAKKGGRTPVQARMKLIAQPVKPRRNPTIHVHLTHQRYHSWKQFLDTAYWSIELT